MRKRLMWLQQVRTLTSEPQHLAGCTMVGYQCALHLLILICYSLCLLLPSIYLYHPGPHPSTLRLLCCSTPNTSMTASS